MKFGISMVQHFKAWRNGYNVVPDGVSPDDYQRGSLANIATADDRDRSGSIYNSS